MNNQNLLIYQLPYLWEIMNELEGYLNFKVTEISNKKNLDDQINSIPPQCTTDWQSPPPS